MHHMHHMGARGHVLWVLVLLALVSSTEALSTSRRMFVTTTTTSWLGFRPSEARAEEDASAPKFNSNKDTFACKSGLFDNFMQGKCTDIGDILEKAKGDDLTEAQNDSLSRLAAKAAKLSSDPKPSTESKDER